MNNFIPFDILKVYLRIQQAGTDLYLFIKVIQDRAPNDGRDMQEWRAFRATLLFLALFISFGIIQAVVSGLQAPNLDSLNL